MQAGSTQRAGIALGPVLFAVLFLATLLTAALAVRAKSPELMLEVTEMPGELSPNDDGERDTGRIAFFVRDADPHAEVYIVGRDLDLVRTLDPDVALEANERVSYEWDATTDEGTTAPMGRYRLRVVLPALDRDIVFPRRIDVVAD